VGDCDEYNSVVYSPFATVKGNPSPDLNPAIWTTPGTPATDCRSNILINGQPPEWPATPVEPRMPGGTPENPDWTGWTFEVGAGETITFTV
jgi:hypothetical protein